MQRASLDQLAEIPVRKATAIVVRDGPSARELLVFEHPDPRGGFTIQLPAGTVESGESPAAAAVRELLEETGVRAEIVGLAGVVDERPEGRALRRWIYVMRPSESTPDEWPFRCDCAAPIRCFWTSFAAAVVVSPQQSWVDRSREWLRNAPRTIGGP